jgi:hypothetical protein
VTLQADGTPAEAPLTGVDAGTTAPDSPFDTGAFDTGAPGTEPVPAPDAGPETATVGGEGTDTGARPPRRRRRGGARRRGGDGAEPTTAAPDAAAS